MLHAEWSHGVLLHDALWSLRVALVRWSVCRVWLVGKTLDVAPPNSALTCSWHVGWNLLRRAGADPVDPLDPLRTPHTQARRLVCGVPTGAGSCQDGSDRWPLVSRRDSSWTILCVICVTVTCGTVYDCIAAFFV